MMPSKPFFLKASLWRLQSAARVRAPHLSSTPDLFGRWLRQTQRYKSATTDQSGHYVLRGLTPGKYKLYALDQIDAGAFYDPDYMAAFESKAETIEVSEGSKLTHELQLIINDEMQ